MQAGGTTRPLSLDGRGSVQPLLSSAATRWTGLPFELHHLPDIAAPFDLAPLPGDRGILVQLDGRGECDYRFGGRRVSFEAGPGCMGFSEGGHPIRVERARGRGKAVVFNLSPVWYGRMLAEGGPESFAELPPLPPSETVRLLVGAICAEVESGAMSGVMFAETLSHSLLCYAAERSETRPTRVRGALSSGQKRRVLRYIDERLHDDLTLAEVAAFSGLRPRHFSTLFRRAFGVSAHRFLIERRLQQGARLLAHSQTDIAEIALRVGFSSQSHFGEAFRKRFGVTPREYVLSHRVSASSSG